MALYAGWAGNSIVALHDCGWGGSPAFLEALVGLLRATAWGLTGLQRRSLNTLLCNRIRLKALYMASEARKVSAKRRRSLPILYIWEVSTEVM